MLKALVIIAAILGVVIPAEARNGQAGPASNQKTQLGVNFLQISNEWPFTNMMKGAQNWDFSDNSNIRDWSVFNSDGYPTVTASGGKSYRTVFYVPTQAEQPGDYIIEWEGNGTVYVGMNNSTCSLGVGNCGSKTSTGGSGFYRFTTNTNRFVIGITTVGSPIITNMRVYHVDDAADVSAGKIFRKKFINRVREGGFAVLRFLDWQFANTTNVTYWATRKPTTYWSYYADAFPPEIYAGYTGGTGDAYTVSAPSDWSGLVDKARVTVTFDRSATTDTTTLQVGVTAAKTIRDAGGNATSVANNSRPLINRSATLIYDATLDVWIKFGGDLANLDYGVRSGVPPELMFELCRTIGIHPYWVAPYMAMDPATDYVPEFMAYVAARRPSWMIPRWEGTNETWNTLFAATQYGMNKATAYGWAGDITIKSSKWYGKIVSVLGQMASIVWSDDRSKYQVIAGVWTTLYTNLSVSDNKLTSADYVAQAAPPQSPYTKTAAYQWVTHVAMANYFGQAEQGTVAELQHAWDYSVIYANNAQQQNAIANAYSDTISLTTNTEASAAYSAWAAGPWGGSYVVGMTFYEGGYSPDYLQTTYWGSSPITGATQANPVVLTLATTDTARYSALSGNPAKVGMMIAPTSVGGMTQLNTANFTATFSSASANISGANSLVLNQAVYFTAAAGSTLPANIVSRQGYYVVSTGNPFQVSATRGGSAIVASDAGSGTITARPAWFVTAVVGNSVSLDAPGDTFSAWTSGGTANYANSTQYVNTLRYAGKFVGAAQAKTTEIYNTVVGNGGVFPSQFFLSGSSTDNTDGSGTIGAIPGQVWGAWDPSVYGRMSTPWRAIQQYNGMILQ